MSRILSPSDIGLLISPQNGASMLMKNNIPKEIISVVKNTELIPKTIDNSK